jgi:hypothetical protein
MPRLYIFLASTPYLPRPNSSFCPTQLVECRILPCIPWHCTSVLHHPSPDRVDRTAGLNNSRKTWLYCLDNIGNSLGRKSFSMRRIRFANTCRKEIGSVPCVRSMYGKPGRKGQRWNLPPSDSTHDLPKRIMVALSFLVCMCTAHRPGTEWTSFFVRAEGQNVCHVRRY